MLHATMRPAAGCSLRISLAAREQLTYPMAVFCRGFARRQPLKPPPMPIALAFDPAAPPQGGAAASSRAPPRTPPQPAPVNAPRARGKPVGGVAPRMGAFKQAPEGWLKRAPFDDPSTPSPYEPLEPDRPPMPWRVQRTISGDLPVYERYRKHGLEATTLVRHLVGDKEHFRRELMKVCEAPVRERVGNIEVRGNHIWKIKEYLKSLGM
eukprot:TRINITY_DN65192_c0_g1_i1.p1 TRINITY_DN65192_c0_g1~~TRINITY_DN65192_c0_g1_i1.p1  ORF type:complete len:209 (+),score=32.41 TRINITY_DN65192_c0_g1_i1:108-734(+)